jgi:hypothetical protein
VNIDDFLRRLGIAAARHEHAAVMTVEESEQLVPPLPGAKTKNLFLRDKKGARHFLVTVPAARTVDLNALGAALATGRLGSHRPSGCTSISPSRRGRSAFSPLPTTPPARSNSSSTARSGKLKPCTRTR